MSHTLVSWIQFYGLIVSLLGFFYVSIGLFEDSQKSKNSQEKDQVKTYPSVVAILRPFLPASAIFLQITVISKLFVPGSPNTWIMVILIGVGIWFSISTYKIIYSKQNQSKKEFFEDIKYNPPLRILVRMLLLAGGVLFAKWDYDMFHNLMRAILLAVCLTLLVISVYAGRYLVFYVSEDTLKIIGIVFSVLGLLTSFLPAVLDVLAIPLN